MIASFRRSEHTARIGCALIGTMIYLSLTACTIAQSLTPPKAKDEVFVDSPRGTVFLQKAQDGWFKTAHPLSLSPAMLTAVLQGVQLISTPTAAVASSPVFSDEDTEFLSALISTALSKATKNQVVGFRVSRGAGDGNETIGGILYVQGRLLHLTFTHYRALHKPSGQSNVLPGIVANPTGLEAYQISFVPETAKRSNRNEQPDVVETPSIASLVIDYEELAAASGLPPISTQSPSVFPVNRPTGARESRFAPTTAPDLLQGNVAQQTVDLEAIREEVRILRQRLTDLDRQLTGPPKP